MRMKKRTVIIGLVALVLIVAGGFGIRYLLASKNYQDAVAEIVIEEPDLSKLADGEYIGEHDVDFIQAKVKVTITNHAIKAIDYVYHKNERGEKASRITEDMIREQKIKVDTISGATNSSKVIQKAVELALTEE
ncbi:FMN-binding protein [Enterococcus sp. JM4C]|uniref:FMN-binding protein n=1 Tax=Candidatus Enterococcus huntleyi TaxID=1857217 RepID=UPI001379A2DE|nr:FMN-binding protein [Enterococcus sp. JM4C]KAF1296402.1 FMN-binding protein [Enterococcus sp. JM4C]